MIRHIVLSSSYQIVDLSCIFMLEGQVADQHSIKHNSATPQVYFQRIIGLLAEHFRSCIARTATGC